MARKPSDFEHGYICACTCLYQLEGEELSTPVLKLLNLGVHADLDVSELDEMDQKMVLRYREYSKVDTQTSEEG